MPWPEPPLPKGFFGWETVPRDWKRAARLKAVSEYARHNPGSNMDIVLDETLYILTELNSELHRHEQRLPLTMR